MNLNEYVQFANENPVTSLMSGHLRCGMRLRPGFFITPGLQKSVWKQLTKNPNVELCFFAPGGGQGAGKMMRVCGNLEFLENKSLEERLFRDLPWVKDLLKSGPKDARLAIFRVAHGEACFWTIENNMRESEVPHLKF
jgi:pyridoxamine 5'-phosphate oxidase